MTQMDQYQRNGLVIVALPDAVLKLKLQLAEQLCLWLKLWGNIDCSAEQLPQMLMLVARDNRPLLGKLYKVARRFPALKQLACEPQLVAMAAELMQTPLVSCCNFVCLRFDIPGEDKYLLGTHQDFPYIQGSENGLTLWLALGDVSLEMGPPSFAAGSHRLGVLPVTELSLAQTYGQNGGSTMSIADPHLFSNAHFVNQPLPNHQALAFSTLLLHRSEQNLSQSVRISIQLRFDDVLHQKSFERNYPEGLYLNNSFAASYPEYVIKN